jgi:hypothetical protein
LNSSIWQKSNLIVTTFFNIKTKSIHHIKWLIIKNSLFVFIYKYSNLLSFSIFWADKNISLFPINIKFTFDLLIDLWSKMERVNTKWLDSVWLDILIIHFVSISCGVLFLSDLLINIGCKIIKEIRGAYCYYCVLILTMSISVHKSSWYEIDRCFILMICINLKINFYKICFCNYTFGFSFSL